MNPVFAEFIGTAILLLLGDGVVANAVLNQTKGQNAGWIVVTFGWGIAVFIAVFIVGQFSGAHINPAVTLGLAASGKFPWADVPGYLVAQFLGAFTGALLVWIHYRDHFKATDNQDAKLGVFATAPAIRNPFLNLVAEIIATFILVLGVLYLAKPSIAGPHGEPGGLGALDALPVGLLVFGIGMSLGGPTGYAINPARDLSPRLVHALFPIHGKGSSDWGYSWVPVIGPAIGGLLAAGFFLLISG